MTFHIYRRELRNERVILTLTDEEFRLAGNNLIHRAWVQRGKPVLEGWRISADELIRMFSGDAESYASRRMIIDYHPSNRSRIPLVEIQEIFLFNWPGETQGSVSWTPMMLRIRDVSDERSAFPMSPDQRRNAMATLEIETYGTEFVEFLYLRGDDGGWNWGGTGVTNSVFLHGQARDYFRQFF